ncbi:hypothetical protein [Streptomyces sp. R41]|uniref:Uncharacterized protein n=1 Tax=Streptomyces sp. R41 TaxID=3238632 RepID=A0AB39RBB8_9ACTN
MAEYTDSVRAPAEAPSRLAAADNFDHADYKGALVLLSGYQTPAA